MRAPLKILYLTPTGVFAGGERVTLDIAAVMRERGHATLYCGLEGAARQAVEKRGVPFASLPSFNVRQVKKLLAREKPQIIHCMDFRASAVAALFFTPFVAHLHANPPWLKRPGPGSVATLLLLLRAGAVITVSSCICKEFIFGHLGLWREFLLPNRVDVAAVQKLARLWGAQQEYDLAFVGRFAEAKQPLLFVDCVARLQKKLPHVRAIMLGDGEQRLLVEKAVLKAGLGGCIHFAGWLENPFPQLAACKVLVAPSAWEGFGLAAVEAMALGKPVVAFNVGGLRDIVLDNCGVLCSSTSELAAAAEIFLSDPVVYSAASSAAVLRATCFSNHKEYYDAVEAIYYHVTRQTKQ